jgi:hypothetical protein
MDLYRLIYCSNNALRSEGAALAADLKLILSNAIRHNEADGVSGGLVFSRNHFVQVLEGAQKAVTSTFTRIKIDPRHTEIILIEAKPITERTFVAWSMGYAGNTAMFDVISESATVDGAIDPSRINADDLVASLYQLVQSEMRMASTHPLAKSPSAA